MAVIECGCGKEWRSDLRDDCPRCARSAEESTDFKASVDAGTARPLMHRGTETEPVQARPTSPEADEAETAVTRALAGLARTSDSKPGETDVLLRSLLAEQRETTLAANRTTHAIRAIVRFIMIQLSFSTAAGFAFPLSPAVAGGIWLVGVVISSSVAWGELALSNVPGSSSGSRVRL